MIELDDHQLLAEFARSGSEEAFATLTTRHVNLVYSAALRFSGNSHHAEEITQAVFIVLARKAGSLRRTVVLSGWLYQTARLTAANFMKGDIRRQRREQEAYMQSTLNEPEAAAWTQIAPLLDEAMGVLPETDRNAVVLRYFENKTAAEIATALKMSEATAHKRVSRAVEKLRKIFTKRGVTFSAATIAGAVAANSVQAAPMTLGQTISAVALAKSAAAGGSTFILAKGVLKIMAWTQIKTATVVVITGVLLTGGITAVVMVAAKPHMTFFEPTFADKLTAKDITAKAYETYAALISYSDEGTTVATVGAIGVAPHTFSIKLARPNLYRVEWRQDSGFFVNSGIVWSAGQGDFLKSTGTPKKQANKETALSSATGISGSASGSIPGTFFNSNWGNQFGKAMDSAQRKTDEKISGVDCYVLTRSSDGIEHTIWIGKQDSLIRQIESLTSAKTMKKTLASEMKKHPELAAAIPSGDVKSVETHRNIEINPPLTASDFAP